MAWPIGSSLSKAICSRRWPADGQFDFVVSNPPYVTAAELEKLAPDVRKFEPHAALLAGPKGTEVIERLIPQAAERLRPGGHLLMEISPTIHDAVCSLLKSDGRFELGPTIKDLAQAAASGAGEEEGLGIGISTDGYASFSRRVHAAF